MKKLSVNPWLWLLNSFMYMIAAIMTSDVALLFWLLIVATFFCSLTTGMMFVRRRNQALQALEWNRKAPLRQLEENLSKCSPDVAHWLRLHYKADFSVDWKPPLHPDARAVIESLEVQREKIKVTDKRHSNTWLGKDVRELLKMQGLPIPPELQAVAHHPYRCECDRCWDLTRPPLLL